MFHRVDDISVLDVRVFNARMLRLGAYQGAVSVALQIDRSWETPATAPEPAAPVDLAIPGTHDFLQGNPMFGPLNGAVGLFEASTVAA